MIPAQEIAEAVTRLRGCAQPLTTGVWGSRPWHTEECASAAAGNCACIVAQGARKPWDEPQIPPIQYVCDAETPGHAAYIRFMHPQVALAFADLLENSPVTPAALAAARACLGKPAPREI